MACRCTWFYNFYFISIQLFLFILFDTLTIIDFYRYGNEGLSFCHGNKSGCDFHHHKCSVFRAYFPIGSVYRYDIIKLVQQSQGLASLKYNDDIRSISIYFYFYVLFLTEHCLLEVSVLFYWIGMAGNSPSIL